MKFKTVIIIACLIIGVSIGSHASERKKYNFNSDWLVAVGDVPDGERPGTDDSHWKRVTLPHAFNEDEAFKLSIERLTDTVSWYRKHFSVPRLDGGKVFVEFEGVRQGADFYLNGHRLGLHENGIMAVGYDLTPYIRKGDNVIAVRIDNDWAYRNATPMLRSSGMIKTSMPTMAAYPRTYGFTSLRRSIRHCRFTAV